MQIFFQVPEKRDCIYISLSIIANDSSLGARLDSSRMFSIEPDYKSLFVTFTPKQLKRLLRNERMDTSFVITVFIPQLLHNMPPSTPVHLSARLRLTLEARLSFFMACIIPRRPWHPDASVLVGPVAGELSWDAASEVGLMLMLSGVEALSSMLGSAPLRQLSVFRLPFDGGGLNSGDRGQNRDLWMWGTKKRSHS